jgi:hypothetical protein
MINIPTLEAINLPYLPEDCSNRKELPNFISKVYSKLAVENGYFSDNQYKLHYVSSYLKGNTQNQI